jgi:hypothetical protein
LLLDYCLFLGHNEFPCLPVRKCRISLRITSFKSQKEKNLTKKRLEPEFVLLSGCSYVGALNTMTAHETACEFRFELCPVPSCSFKASVSCLPHHLKAVLRIHDILGWIRIRGSMPPTNESGSGFWIRILLFSSWTFKMPAKN